MSRRPGSRRRERGSALAAAAVFAVVCASLASTTILVQSGRQREVRTDWASERAFAMAESGIDWGLANVRARRGNVSGLADETVPVAGTGAFTVSYGSGASNGADDDGDGGTDEPDESRYKVLRSTGRVDGVARTLVVLLLSEDRIPSFDAGTIINVDAPVLDIAGNALTMSGFDHTLDGALDPSRPAKWAIASPANPSVIAGQISSRVADQVVGAGSIPSVRTSPAIDLAALVLSAQRATTITLEPGTHATEALGTPTEEGIEVVRCDGDLHLSGRVRGAGVLVVDGDLTISGGFEWVGLVIVRGRVSLVGGGAGKRVVGTLVVGEEVTSGGGHGVSVRGTVDMLFSSAAVELASGALTVPTILTWRETGTP